MNLGLTQPEAEIYVFLAKNGPKKEGDIANQLNSVQQQLNHSLMRLQKKRFVNISVKEEKIFSAVPLRQILENLAKANLEEADRIAKEKENFFPAH